MRTTQASEKKKSEETLAMGDVKDSKEENKNVIKLRHLNMKDMMQAKNQVAASLDEGYVGSIMRKLKNWNDKYGERGSRKKEQLRLKLELQREFFISMPTTLGEDFSLACIAKAPFEDERSTIAITKPNKLTARVHVQDLEQTTQRRGDEPNRILLVAIHHMIYPITVEVLHQVFSPLGVAREPKKHICYYYWENCFLILNAEEADNIKPPLFSDTFGNNGGDESKTSGPETPAREVVDNDNGSALFFMVGYDTGSELVTGIPEEFQEGDMVDTLSRVLEQKSLEYWKELDNESSPNSKSYIVLNKETMKIEESLNVKFDESPPPTSPRLEDDDVLECEIEKVLEIKENKPLNKEIVNIKESKDHPLETVIEPKNVKEAIQDESWTMAMQEELNQFKTNDIWRLVPPPNNQTIIGTKWVFKNKLDENSVVSRNKARLVAQGYNQQEGIYFD
uniref:Retrovirus-related Pol polyprotein from transposon TNT 1-94 n=1 Tax=Tanacetum cinerariifolium TaxID=118510 RepID=A0A6L2P6M2_TANCI|nr:retrovirus-related Pol polyprotein from transposon TNT 1-94 [Tanacetum cinerariifolium]